MKKHHTLAITGWGSGGHILPLISLLQTIDTSSHYRQEIDNIYRFWEKAGMEYKFFTQYVMTFTHIHLQFISILAGKYRRETIWRSRLKNIRDLFMFPIGIIQSLYWILRHHIDIVFCKWWYVSLPVVIAAWLLGKKIYVHDSDTTPWLTTRLASRFATQNFSGFPDTLPNTLPLWQILSDQLVEFNPSLLLPSSKIQILIAGWSLGAKKLYDAVLSAIRLIPMTRRSSYHFTFVNGHHLIDVRDYKDIENNITITDLLTDQSEMWLLYVQSDMAIVRGGTTTLAECKLFDLPLVIVPLPVTHDQAKNAQYYVEQYQDICISQNSEQFVELIFQYITKTQKKHSAFNPQKTKSTIQKAKKIILDMMLLS